MTGTANDRRMAATRDYAHPDCVVCSPDHPDGLNLVFSCLPDGSVEAPFACDARWTGYPGYVQGGIVSSLLDGALTNCLFAHGRVSLTAELAVRFLGPLLVGEPAVVRARMERDRPRLQVLIAEVEQGGEVRATARAKFLPHPDLQAGAPVVNPSQ